MIKRLAIAYAVMLASFPMAGQTPEQRTDVLVLLAHPDDETAVGSWIAQQAIDEHRRVAVVFATNGTAGKNALNTERGPALGYVRQQEARDSLAVLGVNRVWFLNAPDTPSQNVFASLSNWSHGAALAEVVRLIRLTRPQTIVTWVPAITAGENHGDHQAIGVIAVEASRCAAQTTCFPEQLALPRPSDSLVDGIQVWNVPESMFFSNGEQQWQGTVIPNRVVSPSQGVPYRELIVKAQQAHRTQAQSFATPGAGKRPDRTLFPLKRRAAAADGDCSGTTLRLGGAWSFYKELWRTLESPALTASGEADLHVRPGTRMRVPLRLENCTEKATSVLVACTAGDSPASETTIHADGQSAREETVQITVPEQEGNYTLQCTADGYTPVTLRIRVTPRTMPMD